MRVEELFRVAEVVLELLVDVVVGMTTASQASSHERISVLSPLVIPSVTSTFSVGRVHDICITSGREKFLVLAVPLPARVDPLKFVHPENQNGRSHERLRPLPNRLIPENHSLRLRPLPNHVALIAVRKSAVSVTLLT